MISVLSSLQQTLAMLLLLLLQQFEVLINGCSKKHYADFLTMFLTGHFLQFCIYNNATDRWK